MQRPLLHGQVLPDCYFQLHTLFNHSLHLHPQLAISDPCFFDSLSSQQNVVPSVTWTCFSMSAHMMYCTGSQASARERRCCAKSGNELLNTCALQWDENSMERVLASVCRRNEAKANVPRTSEGGQIMGTPGLSTGGRFRKGWGDHLKSRPLSTSLQAEHGK